MLQDLQAWWEEGLDLNKLHRDDNKRLFRSRDITEIAHLVFAGLRADHPPRAGTTSFAIYPGDITSAPDVDGYAVLLMPGLESGAFASLDRSMEGRLGRGVDEELGAKRADPAGAGMIVDVAVDTVALPGRRVMVVKVPWPAVEATASEASIATIAEAAPRPTASCVC